ncbi:MAG: endonuclease/exonuclease/phosphatase family protein [Bacteroidales bacterium]|jgi:endonuclease/exonuclease/phosphatase family metal-dependent hydrolase|nr:endonuclease/exonuclease/phosphatase family protein [Bacteroidales bacterium]
MLKRLLYIVNLVFVALLLLAQVSRYISPNIYDKLSLLTYIYPFLIGINIIFCILWLFIKFRFIIIPLVAIFLQAGSIPRIISITFSNAKELFLKTNSNTNANKAETLQNSAIRFATYNVCGLGYKTKDKEQTTDSILILLKQNNIDIVAMQDFPRITTTNKIHKKFLANGYNYFYSLNLDRNVMDKSVVYSKYPLGNCGGLLPLSEEPDEFIYIDVIIGKDTLRIYNLHLESYLLSSDERNFEKAEDKKGIMKKLLEANKSRAKEADAIAKLLETETKPFIVTGDFNDTPFSYTYQKIAKDLTDAFVKKGKGFGITYDKTTIPFRIDYILTDKHFSVLGYESPQWSFSDHYPVFAVLQYTNTKQ